MNQAKLSTGGAASLLQERVADPPADSSPTGDSVMRVDRGPSAGGEIWALSCASLMMKNTETWYVN